MTIDQSAVASVLGVSATFVDLREGNVAYLPQRVAVVAQGESSVAFSTEKWTATSAAAAGKKFGWRSPIYQILAQLLPANGDGLGTIPVDVFALEDDDDGVAATGTVTPSGTATEAFGARVRLGGVLSKEFVVPEGAVVLNELLRDIGAKCTESISLPGTVGYTYSTVTAGALVGTGNGTLTGLAVHSGKYPKPGAWVLENTATVANGGVWKLTDPDGVVAVTGITQTPGVGAVSAFTDKAGLDFTLTDGTTDFTVGAKFTITVPATNIKLISAWAGSSANDLVLELIPSGDSTFGVTFALVQPTGGLVNPEVDPAIGAFANVWETMVVNGLNIEDTTALDTFEDFGELRWGATVRRPLIVFTGNTLVDIEDATEVCSDRTLDRVNCQIAAPGSPNLPCVVAARAVARIAKVANNAPAVSYQKQRLTGLLPGLETEQWDGTVRDQAVKLGSSTIELANNVIQLADVVTPYRPEGEEPPGWRYVCNIVKVQNAIFNMDIEFSKQEWAAAPVVADEDSVTLPQAKKPKMFKAKANEILENLGNAAILANVADAKKKTTAVIGGANRVNVGMRFPLSANANIIDIDMEFGYLFPAA
jgi:phage tail sheath gpL-like